jgi:hypothetical protein
MHECSVCGTYCDCDGEDLDQPEREDHRCINPDCGSYEDEDWD